MYEIEKFNYKSKLNLEPLFSADLRKLTDTKKIKYKFLYMKKYISAPFCSAFIVPGLGQIINEQLKKGLLLIGLVFILLVAVTFKLAVVINRLMANIDLANINLKEITEKMASEDLSLISILSLCFAVIWIYSIVDAFWFGWKIERGKARKKVEILPH